MPEHVVAFAGAGLRLDEPQRLKFGRAGDAILARAEAALERPLRVELATGSIGLDPEIAQPTLLAISTARYADWLESGGRAVAAVGHSAGMWSAAVVAEAITLEDAIHALVIRGRAIENSPKENEGSMLLLVGPPPAEVDDFLTGFGGAWVAAENGPRSTTVSARLSRVDELVRVTEAERFASVARLPIPFGSHCPLMNEVADRLRQHVEAVAVRAPAIPLFDSATGDRVVHGSVLATLVDNVRLRVRWWSTIRKIESETAAMYLDPVPRSGITNLLREAGIATRRIEAL